VEDAVRSLGVNSIHLEVTRPNITIPNQPDAAKRISAQQAH